MLGWPQVPGIDCSGAFASAGYEIYMLDVQTAFLNANIEKVVFVKMPPGYERSNESGV